MPKTKTKAEPQTHMTALTGLAQAIRGHRILKGPDKMRIYRGRMKRSFMEALRVKYGWKGKTMKGAWSFYKHLTRSVA